MRRVKDRYCLNCISILPDRYKGRQKLYCNNSCRKDYIAKKKAGIL